MRDIHEMSQGELLEACNPHSPIQMLEMISKEKEITIYNDTKRNICMLIARNDDTRETKPRSSTIKVKADNLISLICRAFILWKRNGL